MIDADQQLDAVAATLARDELRDKLRTLVGTYVECARLMQSYATLEPRPRYDADDVLLLCAADDPDPELPLALDSVFDETRVTTLQCAGSHLSMLDDDHLAHLLAAQVAEHMFVKPQQQQ